MLEGLEVFNTRCELRSTYGRDRDDESDESTATGLSIAKFRAKIIRNRVNTSFEGTGIASNDTEIVLLAPYFGKEVIPSAHSVIIDGVGYIVSAVFKVGNKLRIVIV